MKSISRFGWFRAVLLLIALGILIAGVTGHFPSAHDCVAVTAAGKQNVC